MPDHEIENTIQTLTDQVEALLADNEQLREANGEWSQIMNDNDPGDIQRLLDIDAEFDLDDVRNFFNAHDFDELKDALRYESIDELVKAFNKIDEYGDPEEMAEQVERLEEEAQELQQTLEGVETVTTDMVAKADYDAEVAIRQDTQYMLNETQNVLSVVTAERDSYKRSYEEYKASTEYQLDLANGLRDTLAATEENQGLLSEELEHTVAALEIVRADYKRLADYNTRICRECDALREAEPGIYTQAKEMLLLEVQRLKAENRKKGDSNARLNLQVGELQKSYNSLANLYFAEVVGFDDVPSSKPVE
jgi:hypothetical protein